MPADAPTSSVSRLLQGLSRVILASIFAWAAVGKSLDLTPLMDVLSEVLGVAEPARTKPLAIAILACEFGLAIWLLSGRAVVWALITTAGLLVALSLVTYTIHSIHPELGCGCGLPRVFPDLSYSFEVSIRNGLLAGIALIGMLGAWPPAKLASNTSDSQNAPPSAS